MRTPYKFNLNKKLNPHSAVFAKFSGVVHMMMVANFISLKAIISQSYDGNFHKTDIWCKHKILALFQAKQQTVHRLYTIEL